MASTSMYYIVCIALIICAFTGTLLVGLSRENKEGNPGYYKKSGRNWTLLTSFYVITTIALILLFIFLLT